MSGLLQNILTKHYGTSERIETETFVKLVWRALDDAQRSTLYLGMVWDRQSEEIFGSYKQLYGDTLGGFLVGSSLKVATLADVQVFGLYSLQELQNHPEVQNAIMLEPGVQYFMDAANVWFYGIKGETLYAYDAENAEMDYLGPIEDALERLFIEWEMAA